MKKKLLVPKGIKYIIIGVLLLICIVFSIWSTINMFSYEGYADMQKAAFSSTKGIYYSGIACGLLSYILLKLWK